MPPREVDRVGGLNEGMLEMTFGMTAAKGMAA
jgi:hypothetical protein